jgi:hypothetical protein
MHHEVRFYTITLLFEEHEWGYVLTRSEKFTSANDMETKFRENNCLGCGKWHSVWSWHK